MTIDHWIRANLDTRASCTETTRASVGVAAQQKILSDISRCPAYQPTPLDDLPGLVQSLGLGRLMVKEEGQRFSMTRWFAAVFWVFLVNAAQASSNPPPAGIWASSGYGFILQIDPNGKQKLYHAGQTYCVPDNGDGPVPELVDLTMARNDPDGRGFTAYSSENITRWHFTKMDALPAACSEPVPRTDPVENFEYVWQTFADHYAFFAERGIDWFRTYQQFRPQISKDTTPDQLYSVLVKMFHTFDDRHVTLNRPGSDEYRSGLGPVVTKIISDYKKLPANKQTGYFDYVLERLAPHKQLIADSYLSGKAQSAANDQLIWGKIGDVGYLRVDSESYYTDDGNYPAGAKVREIALDKAFKDFVGTKAVILDLRFNMGGNDGHGLAIAGRFTDRAYTAYQKYARHGDGWTVPQSLTVEPKGAQPYRGRVYILTSNVTVSAGENLLLAMMGRPGARRYGEITASVMSDQLTKSMPNGWTFSVSNEVFKAIDGRVYETTGIAPDVHVPGSVILSSAKHDLVIDRVLADVKKQIGQ
jgi:carboxyl-terminal processing protease